MRSRTETLRASGMRLLARRLLSALPCALLFGVLATAGCVSEGRLVDELVDEASRREASAPLGGESLTQRKLELARSYRDLSHFHSTLDGLVRRRDRNATVLLREFCDHYVVMHVLPILQGEWQSRHPEVAVLDANLRFAVAELWLKMGSPSDTDRMLDEIERRYGSHDRMLVAYPLGEQGTVREGIERLRERDWWRG